MIKKTYLNLLIAIICFLSIYVSAANNSHRPVVLLNNNKYWTTFNSITGLTDSCRVGDVIKIKDFTFVYREKFDTLHLYEEGEHNELLYIKFNGKKKIIATKTYKKIIYDNDYKAIDTITINPLSSMDEVQISKLWGIYFEFYSSESWDKFEKVILDSTMFYVSFGKLNDSVFNCTLLPGNINYLKIDANSVDITISGHGVSHLTNLRYFDVDNGYSRNNNFYLDKFRNSSELQFLSIDLNSKANINSVSIFKNLKSFNVFLNKDTLNVFNLKELKNLNYLSMRSLKKENIKNLSKGISMLGNLIELNLSYNKFLTDLNLSNDLNNLNRLNITNTSISNLSFLKHLKNIEYFNASFCPLKEIPSIKLELLKKMEILSTDLSKKQIESFKALNKTETIYDKWISIMTSSLTGVNKLRIRSGGTCHRNPKREKELYLETDKAIVDSIINLIEIDDKNSGHYCACCGSPTFEFYKDSTLVEMFGYHHGQSFRWYNGKWYGDGRLTKKSLRAINQWLSSKGIKNL